MAHLNQLQHDLRTDATVPAQVIADPVAVLQKYGVTLDARQTQELNKQVQNTLGIGAEDTSTMKTLYVFGK